MVCADSYQSLIAAYNSRQPAENLYAQIGKNLSKRIATDAERSNLSFIAIYGGVAQWNNKTLLEQIKILVRFAPTQIDDASLSEDEKRYRIEHYTNLVVLCVASHMKNDNPTFSSNDVASKLQLEAVALKDLLPSAVYDRLQSLNTSDIGKILTDFDFKDSYPLAKKIEDGRIITGKMPGELLRLVPDQVIQYQEAIQAINDQIRETENSPSSVAALPEGDSYKTQIIAGTEGAWTHNKSDGSLSNDSATMIFNAGEWNEIEDGKIIIRGNMPRNQGGMILATGKFVPAPPPPPPPPPRVTESPLMSGSSISSAAATASDIRIPSDVTHLTEQHRTLLKARGLLYKNSANKEERRDFILRLSPEGFVLPEDDSGDEAHPNVTIRKKPTAEEMQRDKEEREREIEIEAREREELERKGKVKKEKYDAAIERLARVEPQLKILENEYQDLLSNIKMYKDKLKSYQPTSAAATYLDDDGWFEEDEAKPSLTPEELITHSLQRTKELLGEKDEIEREISTITIEFAQTTYDEAKIKLSPEEEAELGDYKKRLTLSSTQNKNKEALADKLAKLKRTARSAYNKDKKSLEDQLEKKTSNLRNIVTSINSEETKRETIKELVPSLKEMEERATDVKIQHQKLLREKEGSEEETRINTPKEDKKTASNQNSPLTDALRGGIDGRRLSMGLADNHSDSESDDEDW